MIYEIFKFAFESTNYPWLAFAGAVLVATYSVYILGWLCGGILSLSYSFVYDGQKTLANIMWKYVRFLRGEGVCKSQYNGWYHVLDSLNSGEYWDYYKYDKGRRIGQTDDVRRVDVDGGLQPRPQSPYAGFLFFKGWDYDVLIIVSPLVFVLLFLAADAMPTLAACVGLYYALLLIARKAVRIGTKLTEHINDAKAHANKESNSDT